MNPAPSVIVALVFEIETSKRKGMERISLEEGKARRDIGVADGRTWARQGGQLGKSLRNGCEDKAASYTRTQSS